MSPLSQKQTDEILVYFWVPDGEELRATCTSAFPSPHDKQTINPYLITFLGVYAFGNEIA